MLREPFVLPGRGSPRAGLRRVRAMSSCWPAATRPKRRRSRSRVPQHVERDFMEAWTPERGRANADLAESQVAWREWSFLRGGRPPQAWIDEA